MKIAVTGASGHVGTSLIPALLTAGHEVSVLYYRDDRSFHDLPVQRVKGSVLDTAALSQLIKGAEIVIHLAAEISIGSDGNERVYTTNTEGPRNVCRLCLEHKVRRLIHFSSIHAFSALPFEGVLDESRTLVDQRAHTYDYSKASGEQIVRSFIAQGLDAVILNPTSVIGPGDYKPSLMGTVFLQLYKRQLPALVHGGYDFVDVRDVARAAIQAIDKGRCGEKYLIGGTWMSIVDLAKLVHEVSGVKPPRFTAPFWLAQLGVPFLGIWAKVNHKRPIYTSTSLDILKNAHRNICHAKAERELGFNARPLPETVRDLYSWFREQRYI